MFHRNLKPDRDYRQNKDENNLTEQFAKQTVSHMEVAKADSEYTLGMKEWFNYGV